MAEERKLVATMVVKKETPNKVVFEETDDSPAGGLVGTLYVQKFGVKSLLGGAEKITVTIEPTK